MSVGRANRDEPDLREMLHQRPLNSTAAFVLSDESQSGFRMFNKLDDDSVDAAANWSVFSTAGGRPTQVKFGLNVVDRTRDFESRRFRYIPIVVNKDGASPINLTQSPEELYASDNIGTFFRFNEETRPVDAYGGDQTTTAGYGMVDVALSAARAWWPARASSASSRRSTRSIRSASSSGPSPPRTATPTCSPA